MSGISASLLSWSKEFNSYTFNFSSFVARIAIGKLPMNRIWLLFLIFIFSICSPFFFYFSFFIKLPVIFAVAYENWYGCMAWWFWLFCCRGDVDNGVGEVNIGSGEDMPRLLFRLFWRFWMLIGMILLLRVFLLTSYALSLLFWIRNLLSWLLYFCLRISYCFELLLTVS